MAHAGGSGGSGQPAVALLLLGAVVPDASSVDDARLLQSPNSAAVPLEPSKAFKKQLGALASAFWASGVQCVCVAALVFSFAALFVKLMGDEVPVFEIVAFRSTLSWITCVAFARARGISPVFGHRKNFPYLLARGVCGAIAMTSYYFSIKLLPLADAVTLFFMNPVFTALAAWAFLRERLGALGVLGVVISMGGLVLLTRPPFLFGEEEEAGVSDSGLHGDGSVGVGGGAASAPAASARLLGTAFGLISSLFAAAAFIFIRFIGKSEPALVVSIYFHTCAAATSFVPLAAGFPRRAVLPNGTQAALLLGVAAASFFGQLCIGRGFQLMAAARASAINLTQVVYSYLLGAACLSEHITLLGAAGSVLIAGGAVAVNVRPAKPPPPQQQQQQRQSAECSGALATAAEGAEEGKQEPTSVDVESNGGARGASLSESAAGAEALRAAAGSAAAREPPDPIQLARLADPCTLPEVAALPHAARSSDDGGGGGCGSAASAPGSGHAGADACAVEMQPLLPACGSSAGSAYVGERGGHGGAGGGLGSGARVRGGDTGDGTGEHNSMPTGADVRTHSMQG